MFGFDYIKAAVDGGTKGVASAVLEKRKELASKIEKEAKIYETRKDKNEK